MGIFRTEKIFIYNDVNYSYEELKDLKIKFPQFAKEVQSDFFSIAVPHFLWFFNAVNTKQPKKWGLSIILVVFKIIDSPERIWYREDV